MLSFFSSKLVGVARECTFDVVYSQMGEYWEQRDDLPVPFHDPRWAHVSAVFIFDLDREILRLNKADCKLWVPLNLVRERPIIISDLKPLDHPPTLSKHDLGCVFSRRSNHQVPWSEIRLKNIDPQRILRRKPFVSRLLADFAFQWRHVLRDSYNNFTFRRFATAVIKIVTLDFTVEEETFSGANTEESLVGIKSLPEWDFTNEHITRVDGTCPIVICQHIPHAVELIRSDFAKYERTTPGLAQKGFTYLILSIREVMLFRTDTEGEIYTEPERLFDGIHPPSDKAVEVLLHTMQERVSKAPLHKLPVELQDAILDEVSAGPIEGARIGCLLDAGSIFTWKCGSRDIEREEVRRSRTSTTPVESHICFDGFHGGVVYK